MLSGPQSKFFIPTDYHSQTSWVSAPCFAAAAPLRSNISIERLQINKQKPKIARNQTKFELEEMLQVKSVKNK